MCSLYAQSWLVSLFMDCPPNFGITCPSEEEVEVSPAPAIHVGNPLGSGTWAPWLSCPENNSGSLMFPHVSTFYVLAKHGSVLL